MAGLPKLYSGLAQWWPQVSPVSDYDEEVGFSLRLFEPSTLRLALVDPSHEMLDVSRALNPECEHIAGGMRSARVVRVFDRVLIHDAIKSMTTLDELRQAIETAYVHPAPGGIALFVPDALREN